jgi:2'-5' RNA ligase
MIKKYVEFMKESKEKPGNLYKYGCVMLQLNISNWEELISTIREEDVYLPEDPSHGVETNPHVTILYGLHPGVTVEQVKAVFANFHGEIHVEVDGVGIFENDDFDVVKLNVVPDGSLQELHDKLKEFPNSDQYPVYHPHITLAYVNKGMGRKYANPNYKYTIKDIGKIKYSTPEGEKVYFDVDEKH